MALCAILILADIAIALNAPDLAAAFLIYADLPASQIEAFLGSFSGYAIAAQTGVLGVVSIAIALVALIAERQGAATDVEVYYHASLALEVVASCIALLLVLCIQLVWPLHFLAHYLTPMPLAFSKPVLMIFHLAWLALNLSEVDPEFGTGG